MPSKVFDYIAREQARQDQTVELIAEEPTPDENTETTQPTETPAEPQNAPQPVELTDRAG